MKKLSSFILIFILLFVCIGCNSKPPEGISQEFWDESREVVDVLKDGFQNGKIDKQKSEILNDYILSEKIKKKQISTIEKELYDSIYSIWGETFVYLATYKDNTNTFEESKKELEVKFEKLKENYGL